MAKVTMYVDSYVTVDIPDDEIDNYFKDGYFEDELYELMWNKYEEDSTVTETFIEFDQPVDKTLAGGLRVLTRRYK